MLTTFPASRRHEVSLNVFWLYLAIMIIVGVVVSSWLLFVLIRWLAKREPYSTFMRLRTRRKLTFFRLMLRDKRVPLYVKAIPFAVVVYLSIPFDIIPDFIPVLGYLDTDLVGARQKSIALGLTHFHFFLKSSLLEKSLCPLIFYLLLDRSP